MIKLSVIIPARNEFPNVVHTAYSILHCLEAEKWDLKTVEIIIVNNCSTDARHPQRGTGGTTDYLLGRGAYFNRVIRMVYDPLAGNHSARNKGAAVARGEYLFFSDAHMAYKPGFFTSILKTVDETGGLVHGALQFMGAYPPQPESTGYAYTLKLGEEIKGTWNNYRLADSWWYIPAQGHWGLAVKREQFLDFGGYPKIHRTYGGGEFYTDIKWWMFGSTVATDPNAIGYHLAAGRGYGYDHNDYLENVLGMAFALGMDDWRERAYLNILRKANREVLDRIMARGEREYAEDREFVAKRRMWTFNELLQIRPWDERNDVRHGKHNGMITIFHDTWLKLIREGDPAHGIAPSPEVVEAYEKSRHQAGLEKFINENLGQFVFRRTTGRAP